MLATDETGYISWKAIQEAFGAVSVQQHQSRINMNLRFPGQYYDQETGTHYNFHRDYKPNAGRYVQSDPIGLEGGVNMYGYAVHNPVENLDFDGLWVRRCSRKLGSVEKGNVHPREPLRHDYLVISGSVLSFGPEEGGSLFGAPGRQIPGERPDRACVSVCDDDKFDKYVYEAFNAIGYPRYCVVAFKWTPQYIRGERNCQSWVDDILEQAISMYLENEDCPECFR